MITLRIVKEIFFIWRRCDEFVATVEFGFLGCAQDQHHDGLPCATRRRHELAFLWSLDWWNVSFVEASGRRLRSVSESCATVHALIQDAGRRDDVVTDPGSNAKCGVVEIKNVLTDQSRRC